MKLKEFAVDLRPKFEAFQYQSDAFNASKDHEYFGIFHEQGLGKTKIAIDLALHWVEKGICDSVIFVTKKNLVDNWSNEVRAHTSIYPIVFDAQKKENTSKFNSYGKLYICHYDLVKNDIENFESFCNFRKVGMVLDESVAIKNPNSINAKSFHRLTSLLTRRVIMTGTPVDNRPYDIWSQIYFLDGGKSLGTNFNAFKKKYDLDKELTQSAIKQEIFERNLLSLKKSISGFTLRETKQSCLIELPNKEFRNIKLQFEDNQRKLYEKVRSEIAIELVKEGQNVVEYLDFIAVRLLRLIQISANPKGYDESYTGNSPKIIAVKKLIDEIQADEKVIIWTQFIKSAKLLEKEIPNSTALHGEKPIEERNLIINNFKTVIEDRVLIATYGTAKEGLTLTVANHAIYFERNFSLSDYLQSQDRIHRISQTKTSYVYNLIIKDSIEEWVEALVNAKNMAAGYIQGDVSEDEYKEKINYSFNRLLTEILEV